MNAEPQITLRAVADSDWTTGDQLCRVEFKRDADSEPEVLFRVVSGGGVEMGKGWNPEALRAVADWLEKRDEAAE